MAIHWILWCITFAMIEVIIGMFCFRETSFFLERKLFGFELPQIFLWIICSLMIIGLILAIYSKFCL